MRFEIRRKKASRRHCGCAGWRIELSFAERLVFPSAPFPLLARCDQGLESPLFLNPANLVVARKAVVDFAEDFGILSGQRFGIAAPAGSVVFLSTILVT